MNHLVSLPFKAEEVGILGERVGLVTVIGFGEHYSGPLAIVVFENGRLGYVEVKNLQLPSDEPERTA